MPILNTVPSADSYVDQGNPTTNYGSAGMVKVGNDPNGAGAGTLCRGWLMFDISSIPVGSTINSVKITVNVYYSFGNYNYFTIDFKRCTDVSWTEGGITWNNAPDASVSGTVSGSWEDLSAPGINYEISSAQLATDVSNSLSDGKVCWRLSNNSEGDGYGVNTMAKDYSSSYPTISINYTEPTSTPNQAYMKYETDHLEIYVKDVLVGGMDDT